MVRVWWSLHQLELAHPRNKVYGDRHTVTHNIGNTQREVPQVRLLASATSHPSTKESPVVAAPCLPLSHSVTVHEVGIHLSLFSLSPSHPQAHLRHVWLQWQT